MKYKLGLFDNPYRYGGEEKEKNTLFNDSNLFAAKELAKKSMVLLQNKNNVLPVKEGKKIALIGPFANHKREMLGSWVLAPDPKRTVTFLEGLESRYGQQNVYFAPGCQDTRRDTRRFQGCHSPGAKSGCDFLHDGTIPKGKRRSVKHDFIKTAGSADTIA